jgi:PPOX class probable F420-dependent enzyme
MIDLTNEFGRRVARRLEEERIGWLTTVSGSGVPAPRPIWFLWDGESFLIYSKPDTHKLRHIALNPRVAINLDGDGLGGDIVVFAGAASVDREAPPADQNEVFIEKYEDGLTRINMTPSEFSASYSVPIRIQPISLRGH